MKPKAPRATLAVFAEFLLKGQQMDWRYKLVVILIITATFFPPLAVGSIRSRVYVAVKEQIEKENNAREISLQPATDGASRLDERLVAELEGRFPDHQIVGTQRLAVGVEGPQGTDLLNLQTLTFGDPSHDGPGIVPGLSAALGLTDLVLSDISGRLLYGSRWEDLWSDGDFLGPPLKLRVNNLALAPAFTVVSRRVMPVRGLYGSRALSSALRRYALGFGAVKLGLPTNLEQVEQTLPQLTAAGCVLVLEKHDPTCDAVSREQLLQRLRELRYVATPSPPRHLAMIEGFRFLDIAAGETQGDGAQSVRREQVGDCGELLAPHLVGRCGSALVTPDLTVELTLERATGEAVATTVAAATQDVRRLLPAARALVDRFGEVPASAGGLLGLTVAASSGLTLAEEVSLRLAGEWMPARIEGFYACPGDGPCPAFADPLTTFRLRNLRERSIEIVSRDPLTFVPANQAAEYDEVLVYVPGVERIEAVSEELRSLLPGIDVLYDAAALEKLRGQDVFLSVLFNVTVVLSVLFVVLALGALAGVNVERCSRQMAHMLILGFTRRFVRRLIVAEYLLLTALSSLMALGLTAFLCVTARAFLDTPSGAAERGLEIVVRSISVDGVAFLQVFFVVVLCTGLIAQVSARRVAASDPMNLLDK